MCMPHEETLFSNLPMLIGNSYGAISMDQKDNNRIPKSLHYEDHFEVFKQ